MLEVKKEEDLTAGCGNFEVTANLLISALNRAAEEAILNMAKEQLDIR